MSDPELHSLDDYQQFVTSTIKPWTREKRIALAAAMAERWLPVYESFSEEEDWGDPSILQRALDAVWNCALGKKLTTKDQKLHKNRVDENTPHTDDFAVDIDEVIATTAMIDYALSCCVSDDNTGDAVMAMVSAFEGVAPGIYTDAGELPEDVLQSSQYKDLMKKELNPLLDNLPEVFALNGNWRATQSRMFGIMLRNGLVTGRLHGTRKINVKRRNSLTPHRNWAND